MAAPKGNQYALGNHGGAPPKYTDASEMKALIDKYYEDCQGKPYIKEDGEPLLNKYGEVVIVGAKPPTITGLALALGFNSRQSLLNYMNKNDEFMDAITRGKSFVEEYTEGRLFDRDGATGAKFSLANNFKGWSEKIELNPDQDGVIKVSFVNSDE